MEQRHDNKQPYLAAVLFAGTILGMVVALAVYFGWRFGLIPPGLNHIATEAALALCPPFILSVVVAPAPDSSLSFVLVVGTIVFANAFLYAGVAAGAYFVVTLIRRK